MSRFSKGASEKRSRKRHAAPNFIARAGAGQQRVRRRGRRTLIVAHVSLGDPFCTKTVYDQRRSPAQGSGRGLKAEPFLQKTMCFVNISDISIFNYQ